MGTRCSGARMSLGHKMQVDKFVMELDHFYMKNTIEQWDCLYLFLLPLNGRLPLNQLMDDLSLRWVRFCFSELWTGLLILIRSGWSLKFSTVSCFQSYLWNSSSYFSQNGIWQRTWWEQIYFFLFIIILLCLVITLFQFNLVLTCRLNHKLCNYWQGSNQYCWHIIIII